MSPISNSKCFILGMTPRRHSDFAHNHVTISPPRLSHLIHSCCSACSAVRRCDGSNFNSILINAWNMEKHPEVPKKEKKNASIIIYMILCSLPQAWRWKMTTLQRNLLCDRSIFHLDEPLHLRRCVSSPRRLQLQLQANANHKDAENAIYSKSLQ